MTMRLRESSEAHLHAVSAEALPQVEPGTAYVSDVMRDGPVTWVRLKYANGVHVNVETICEGRSPRRVCVPATIERLLAVNVRVNALGIRCSVVGTSRSGPRRVPITLDDALELADVGTHTVFQVQP